MDETTGINDLTDAGDVLSEIVVEVFRLNGVFMEAGDLLTAPVGQTSARWQVLAVAAEGPASVSQVARTMGLTRQSVQRTADLLAADGLVEYVDNPHHRRAKLMKTTPEARDVLDYIKRQQAVWANRIGDRYDLDDMKTTATLLRQMRERFEKDKQDRRDGKDGDSQVDSTV